VNGQGYGYAVSSDLSSNQQMKFGPGEISPDLEYEYEYYDLDETGVSSITHIQQGQIKGHGQNKGQERVPDVHGISTAQQKQLNGQGYYNGALMKGYGASTNQQNQLNGRGNYEGSHLNGNRASSTLQQDQLNGQGRFEGALINGNGVSKSQQNQLNGNRFYEETVINDNNSTTTAQLFYNRSTKAQQNQLKGPENGHNAATSTKRNGLSSTVEQDQANGNFHDLGGLINGDATYDEMMWKERVHIGHKEENTRSAEVTTYYKGKPSSPNGTKIANRVTQFHYKTR
jgi:hypothetical protein